ncbi:MAG: metal-dependent hydrolase [Acidimicrobiales bacterium]
MRRVDFSYPDDFDPRWHPRLPEFSCGANAVSLLMPHVEPFVARVVRDGLEAAGPEQLETGTAYVRQETQHHRQHRRFNQILLEHYRGLTPIDRAMGWACRTLDRWTSPAMGLAFAAGFETVAYSSARWVAGRRTELLGGADPAAASLFLWHLAEEVEHKSVAHDVWRAGDGHRWRLMVGTLLAMVLLAVSTVAATLVMLVNERRILHPLAHLRLARWTFGLTFTVLPDVAVALSPRHHPDDFVDPSWYKTWLAEFDAESGTMPLWEASIDQ